MFSSLIRSSSTGSYVRHCSKSKLFLDYNGIRRRYNMSHHHLPFSSLARWQKAVKKVAPVETLLTETANKGHLDVMAFLGDKILGSATALALVLKKCDAVKDARNLHRYISGALSNQFLAANVHHILPKFENNNGLYSDWEIGSMIEAAVATVHKQDPDAVNELASFLVEQAQEMRDPNCKGRLLELGGSVTSVRIGGTDHAPIYTATARLDDKHCPASHSRQPQTCRNDGRE